MLALGIIMLIFGTLTLIGGIIIESDGWLEASIWWETGIEDPGMMAIIIGVVLLVLGVIFIVVAGNKKKSTPNVYYGGMGNMNNMGNMNSMNNMGNVSGVNNMGYAYQNPQPTYSPSTCSNCGAALASNSKFCMQCGQIVGSAQEQSQTSGLSCSSCGEINAAGSKFCKKCGHLLNS